MIHFVEFILLNLNIFNFFKIKNFVQNIWIFGSLSLKMKFFITEQN